MPTRIEGWTFFCDVSASDLLIVPWCALASPCGAILFIRHLLITVSFYLFFPAAAYTFLRVPRIDPGSEYVVRGAVL